MRIQLKVVFVGDTYVPVTTQLRSRPISTPDQAATDWRLQTFEGWGDARRQGFNNTRMMVAQKPYSKAFTVPHLLEVGYQILLGADNFSVAIPDADVTGFSWYIEAECQDDYMKIRIGFNGSFGGLLYSSGYSYDPDCVYINGTGRDYYEFYIQLNRCGTLGKNSRQEDARKNPAVWKRGSDHTDYNVSFSPFTSESVSSECDNRGSVLTVIGAR
ncbi:hypothetical protein ACFE04_021848 [Oxalis oulophora]